MRMDVTSTIHSLALSLSVKHLAVGSGSLLIYDYLLTLSDEVRLVWPAPWGLGKVLFFLTRYPLYGEFINTVFRIAASSPSASACHISNAISGWLTFATLIIADIIMVMRVWAMWDRSRRIGVGLAMSMVIFIAIAGVMFAFFTKKQDFFDPNNTALSSIPGCHGDNNSNSSFISFLLLMSFNILMLVMTIVKAIPALSDKPSSFLVRLYWDGVFYYGVLSVVSLLNVVILLVEPQALALLFVAPQRTLHSIFSARLLLRLRDNARRRKSFTGPVGSSVFLTNVAASVGSIACNPEQTRWFGDANSNLGGGDCHDEDEDAGPSCRRNLSRKLGYVEA